jgi:hypothetical protein
LIAGVLPRNTRRPSHWREKPLDQRWYFNPEHEAGALLAQLRKRAPVDAFCATDVGVVDMSQLLRRKGLGCAEENTPDRLHVGLSTENLAIQLDEARIASDDLAKFLKNNATKITKLMVNP